MCIPVADEADDLAAMMISQLLERLGCDVRHLPLAPRSNILNEVATNSPKVALVSALPPFAAGQARSFCKRLRQRHPELTIVLGLWNFEGGVAEAQARIGPDCADFIATSLQQAILLMAQANCFRAGQSPASRSPQAPTVLENEIVTADSQAAEIFSACRPPDDRFPQLKTTTGA